MNLDLTIRVLYAVRICLHSALSVGSSSVLWSMQRLSLTASLVRNHSCVKPIRKPCTMASTMVLIRTLRPQLTE